ncbi:MAG: ribonuclease E activity regulator RraA [Burkholderiaceae bacterium]|nr:ribonuclease E activity regulator RraA [Burkholderiaceae bacterium]MEB2319437.1 ribonuclease E activity regulator RraA [Pseudomonadota bacterium]
MLLEPPATTDLCDANEARLDDGSLRVLSPLLRCWGGRTAFAGPAATVRCFEDNTLVRSRLETPGEGRVLVVDGGASLRYALLGGNLAVLAERNGWAGVLVNGCVRDTVEIDACAIGVRALAAMPRRSRKLGGGSIDVPVDFGGIAVAPGQWIYADADGVLVSDLPLH